MNDGTKVQIKSEKTPIAKKFFHDCGQKKPHQKTFTLLFAQKKQHYFVIPK